MVDEVLVVAHESMATRHQHLRNTLIHCVSLGGEGGGGRGGGEGEGEEGEEGEGEMGAIREATGDNQPQLGTETGKTRKGSPFSMAPGGGSASLHMW